MITLSSAFRTSCVKQTNSSIFKLDMETSYNRAKATLKEDWQGGSGDADINTIDGGVVCKTLGNKELSPGGFGTTQLYYSNLVAPAFVMKAIRDVILPISAITWNMNLNISGTAGQIVTWFAEIEDDLERGSNEFTIISVIAQDLISQNSVIQDQTSISPNMYLEAGKKYIFMMNPNTYSGAVDSYNGYIRYVQVTDRVFSQAVLGKNHDNILYIAPTRVTVTGTQYYYNEFSGYYYNKSIKVYQYADSTLTTHLFSVLDQYGTVQNATTGEFRASERTPNDTSVNYDIHLYASGLAISNVVILGTTATVTTPYAHGYSNSDVIYIYNSGIIAAAYTITVTGTTTFTFTTTGTAGTYSGGGCYKKMSELTSLADGDAIDFDGHPNCRFVLELATTSWYKTPIVDAVEAYFPTTQSFVKSDDSLGTALPLLNSMPSYESQLDPIGCKCSISEPEFRMVIDKEDDKGISETEQLVYNHYLSGNEVVVTFGFKDMTSTSDYCAVTTGVIMDYEVDNTSVKFRCSDVLRTTKDPFGFDSAGGIQQLLYSYEHPADIILDLLYRLGVPHRLIDTASFTTAKALLPSWQFYRYFDEYESDLKALIDEICELTEYFLIPQEDGKLYLKYPYDSTSVFTFDDNNSIPSGKANINLEYRINECQVRRGFWDEYNCTENTDNEYYERVINYDSLRQTNLNTVKVYDNKWIPKDVQIGGKYINQIVGERKTNRFGYGIRTLKRLTPISGDEYAKVQVSDKVTVKTDQVLARGIYGYNTFNAIVLSKKYDIEESTIEWGLWLL